MTTKRADNLLLPTDLVVVRMGATRGGQPTFWDGGSIQGNGDVRYTETRLRKNAQKIAVATALDMGFAVFDFERA